jgi:hypothetical protein
MDGDPTVDQLAEDLARLLRVRTGKSVHCAR